MPTLRIRTRRLSQDTWLSNTVFNYPDSSILSHIQETLHLEITEPVTITRKGSDLWVVGK